ncbi:MAG: hypothetical protein GF401_10100 [Chitinivibrionales bacterium]|nr:hypothetical protein [Chitinivibrionales bacterium]
MDFNDSKPDGPLSDSSVVNRSLSDSPVPLSLPFEDRKKSPSDRKVIDVPPSFITFGKWVGSHSQTWLDEVGMMNLGLRVPHSRCYSLFTAGIIPSKTNRCFSVGYGIGKDISLPGFCLNVDLLTQALNVEKLELDKLDFITRIRLSGEWKINSHMNFFAGVSWSNITGSSPTLYAPHWNAESIRQGRTWKKKWPGFFIGIQF